MGHFMRCDHILPNGKRCRAETPDNRSSLQGNDWFVEPLIGGTRTICPKHKGPHQQKQIEEQIRRATIDRQVEEFRRKIEREQSAGNKPGRDFSRLRAIPMGGLTVPATPKSSKKVTKEIKEILKTFP